MPIPVTGIFLDTSASQQFLGDADFQTVSYENADRAVIANLATGTSYKLLKIMPFGDSITYGVVSSTNDTEGGGYRKILWDSLSSRSVTIDFTGSLSNGPSGFDADHDGHRGWTLNQLNDADANLIGPVLPDALLVMAGTNDSRDDSVSTMLQDLRALLVSITENAPHAVVFVASVPPIRVGQQSQARADRVDAYNDGMPAVIDELRGLGRSIVFVDMRSLTVDDIAAPSVDSGLHPSAAGYAKIAALWESALEQHFGLDATGIGPERDSFSNIANLIGSSWGDRLTGNSGDNLLIGGAGNDTLVGGTGNDRFLFAAGDGQDVISDFAPGS
ncbi:MAG: GDSL-type esterase/lipase family protein, partial [Pseudomonadota bacterium]